LEASERRKIHEFISNARSRPARVLAKLVLTIDPPRDELLRRWVPMSEVKVYAGSDGRELGRNVALRGSNQKVRRREQARGSETARGPLGEAGQRVAEE
jgi:hypothetical protein